MHWVFAFDRDDTVAVDPKRGPIPLEWVRHLAHETPHEVWATGNQTLCSEAEIPGTAELIERYEQRWGDPREHFAARSHPKVEEPVDLPHDAPDPDIVTAVYLHQGYPAPRGFSEGKSLSRRERLRLLAALRPECTNYFVIDNKYLGDLDPWTHLYPAEFVELVETFAPLPAVAPSEDVEVPATYDWPLE